MQWETGLPEDLTVNTFHVQTGVGLLDLGEIAVGWQGFMNEIRGLFGDLVAQSGHTLKAYDLADPMPRAPVDETAWAFTSAPTGETLPTQVAYVVSYQAARVSGEPQRNRRGRMYLGPCSINVTVDARPDFTPDDFVPSAFAEFITTIGTAGQIFVIYSRVLDDVNLPVQVWADNSWDIQRRRQLTPTARAVVDLPLP